MASASRGTTEGQMLLPKTMTRQRALLATSHGGRYAYYHDLRYNYVYQLRLADMLWIGWLCEISAWSAFAKFMDRGCG